MSFQYDARKFARAQKLPLLVLIDPVRRHLEGRNGLDRNNIAGVIADCRKAVHHARAMGMPIAFVHDEGYRGPHWILGLAPERADMVFARSAPSLYANAYFPEVATEAGALLLASFPGDGGALATAADAIGAGQAITFLQDALLDVASRRILIEPVLATLAAHTPLNIAACGTHRWFHAHAPAFADDPLRTRAA
jgi:nicotinamidase-related amidase